MHNRLAVRLAQKNIDLVEMLYLDELKVISDQTGDENRRRTFSQLRTFIQEIPDALHLFSGYALYVLL